MLGRRPWRASARSSDTFITGATAVRFAEKQLKVARAGQAKLTASRPAPGPVVLRDAVLIRRVGAKAPASVFACGDIYCCVNMECKKKKKSLVSKEDCEAGRGDYCHHFDNQEDVDHPLIS